MFQSDVNPLDFLIHVVDDATPNVVLLSYILEAEGFKVMKSYDGDEALEKIKETPPDLILLDIKMPTMSGIEVGEELKRTEFQNIPIIFLSSTNESVDKVKAFEAGGVDFVQKPFDKDELIVRIRNHLMLKVLKSESERQFKVLKNRELELSKANTEKNALMRMLSHDIKNPLSGIIGLINILTEDKSLEEAEKEEMLFLIKESSDKLLGVVKNVLDKEVNSQDFEDVSIEENDLVEVAKEVLNANSAKTTLKKIKLKFESTKEPVIFGFDRQKIYDTLNTLVSNGVKFTLSGGLISLKIEIIEETDTVLISISDTGIGIPNEMLSDFLISSDKDEPHNSKKVLGGGLGLEDVLFFVKAHEGKIWVQSQENKGTTFFIELPMNN